jgi:predicted XRE-type DNA-binding protein
MPQTGGDREDPHVTQPRVSDLLRGRMDLFSTDALIDMLARLGAVVRLVVKQSRPPKVA